jgi:AcrR family transcriptional regulator
MELSISNPSVSTRQRLFEAAVELFAQRGYGSVSIREITRAVGIKESSFYNHYASKELLLSAILETFQAEYRKALPPEEMLDELVRLRDPAEFWRRGAGLFKATLSTPLMKQMNRILNLEQYHNPLARQIILEDILQRPMRFTELVFRKFIEQGKIKPYDPALLAREYQYPIYALFIHYLVLDAAGEDTTAIESQIEDHIQFFSELVRA